MDRARLIEKLPFPRFRKFITDVVTEWKRDNATMLAASVAFYATFSLAPLLVLILAAVRLFLGDEAARQHVVSIIASFVNERTATAVQRMIVPLVQSDNTGVTITSAVLLMAGASGVFRHLRVALNLVLDVPNEETPGWRAAIKGRLVAVVMVVVTLLVLLSTIVLTATLGALRRFVPKLGAIDLQVWQAVDLAVTTVVVAAMFAAVLKFVPDMTLAWRNVRVGAISAAVLFTAGRYLLGLYMSRTNIATLYGAAASLFVILVATFFAIVVLFLAAEITEVLSRRDSEVTEDRRRRKRAARLRLRRRKNEE